MPAGPELAIVALVACSAAHATLLGWSFALAGGDAPRLWIPRLLLAGMIYDNLVLTLGNAGVGSAWYAAASSGRFVLHAALLPLLVPYALAALRAAAVPLAQRGWFVAGCWLVAMTAWGYGFLHDVGRLELAVEEVFGHLRLANSAPLPPLGTIAVNLLLVVLAFALWRHARRPLLLVGALFILLVNAAVGARPWGYLAGNGAEVVFMLCLLVAEQTPREVQPSNDEIQ